MPTTVPGSAARRHVPAADGGRARRHALAVAGLVLIAVGGAGLTLGGDLLQRLPLSFAFYGLAALGFLLVFRAPSAAPRRAAIVLALALRLAFLPVAPSLSDDVYRYVWDGRVQAAGIDPYKYAPSNPRLDGVAYADRGRINHPDTRTIYPPLAEVLFLAVGGLGGGLLAFRLVFGAFDLLAALALVTLVERRRRPAVMVLYLLCPLTIVETWGSIHLEVVAVALVVAAAALLRRGRHDGAAGVALGLAAAVKLTPAALLIPALVGRRARPLPFLAAFLVAWLVPYVPYLLWGGATGSLFSGGDRQNVNSLLFFLLAKVLPYAAAAALCLLLAAALIVAASRRLSGRDRTAAAFAWSATILLLCMPAVHSWYWLTPLVLSLAAGLRLPVYLGLGWPAAEAAWVSWPQYRGWTHLLSYGPALTLLKQRRRPAVTVSRTADLVDGRGSATAADGSDRATGV